MRNKKRTYTVQNLTFQAGWELQKAIGIINQVETRCMASDGPVTPTLKEITEKEFAQVFKHIAKAKEILG